MPLAHRMPPVGAGFKPAPEPEARNDVVVRAFRRWRGGGGFETRPYNGWVVGPSLDLSERQWH